MDELLLFTLTNPPLHFRRTGSFLPIILTSSSLNSDGRAPTIHTDEPFAAFQTDGLLPTNHIELLQNHIDELFPTALPNELFLTALPDELFLTTLPDELFPIALPGELFPTTLPDELSPSTHVDDHYSTTYTDEPFPSARKDELYSPPSIDDLIHKQDAQLRNQVNTRKSDDEGHRLNLTNSTYANYIV